MSDDGEPEIARKTRESNPEIVKIAKIANYLRHPPPPIRAMSFGSRMEDWAAMFFIIPYHVDVPMHTRPWMNWVLIAITVLFFPLVLEAEALVLGASGLGWVGHVLLHADPVHLLGNMLFLWVFGNAVCAKVGNLVYPIIYFGLGFVAGGVSYLIDPRPAVGASGAINGIVGMFVVWYLLIEIACW